MTFKLLLTALLSSLATALAVYAMEPAEATEATQATARSREWSAVSPVTVWPPPGALRQHAHYGRRDRRRGALRALLGQRHEVP